jgi:hypothetical protein
MFRGCPTTKYRRIPTLNTQCCNIYRHIGTSFIDSANDTERDTNLGEVNTVRHIVSANNDPNGIWKANNVTNSLRKGSKALGCEPEAIEKTYRHS